MPKSVREILIDYVERTHASEEVNIVEESERTLIYVNGELKYKHLPGNEQNEASIRLLFWR